MRGATIKGAEPGLIATMLVDEMPQLVLAHPEVRHGQRPFCLAAHWFSLLSRRALVSPTADMRDGWV